MNAETRNERGAAAAEQGAPPRPIAYAAKNTDLLLADAAERSRAAEWPWDMWCRICHIRPTSHRTEAEALEAADRHVKLQHAPQAEVHKLMAAGGLAEIEHLRARVAALEAQRAALAARLRAGQRWERGRNPELVSENYVSQSELREIFGIPLAAPWESETAEAPYVSRLLPPRDAACARPGCGHSGAEHHHGDTKCWAHLPRTRDEFGAMSGITICACSGFVSPEDPHDSPLHHSYETGRDLPETGGTK